MPEAAAAAEPKQAANLVTSENRAEFMAERLNLAKPETPAQAEGGTPAEQPPPAEAPAKGEPTEEAEAAAEPSKDAPKGDAKDAKGNKHGINERFAKMAEQRRLAEEKATKADEARQKAEAEAAELRAKLAPPKAKEPEGEPQRAQFASDHEYAKAMAVWGAEQVIAERDKAIAEAAALREQTQRAETWDKRIAAAKEEVPDFAEIVAASKAVVSDQVRDAIFESELGPKLLLHFATPEGERDAERIAKLTVGGALKELGKIEAKLEAKGERKDTVTAGKKAAEVEISRAPAPITPLKGNGSVPESPVNAKGEFVGDYATWKALRKAGKMK